MLDDNGQPVNVTALLADLKKERSTKAALEEKNAGLRKRVQRMLIENDEVRVKAKNEVVAAHHREIAEAQNQLAVYAHNRAYTTELRSLVQARHWRRRPHDARKLSVCNLSARPLIPNRYEYTIRLSQLFAVLAASYLIICYASSISPRRFLRLATLATEGLAKFLQTTESMYLQAYINFLKDMGKKKRYAKTVAVINANA
ncbi:hypothetical protein AM587_10005275 [Phytophthora nicotianae]|uniref:Uncharacterized protein n=1 Tax=Phytophthora nicotianae TaxID=4792 RepID=A0A0W8CF38_PHYNI|nr:hypothetical protein AM587_10005275 [Phytophthora nicotianae]